MVYSSLSAYEGSENYIFISYAHRDSDRVFPIMEFLSRQGYRIWYDEGISPGSEWPEEIAQHLNNSAMVMAFVTPNSMASVNCRREINFALSRQKPFLSVMLEPTEMPLGMELQLSAQQSVLRHNFPSEEKFLEKICACPELACCLAKSAPAWPAAPVTEPKPEPRPHTTEPPAAPPQPKKNKWLIPAIAVAAVLIAVTAVALLLKPAEKPARPEMQVAEAEEKEALYTVYVRIPDHWANVHLWAWEDSTGREAFQDAGVRLEPHEDGWYTATFPAWANRLTFGGNDWAEESAVVTVVNQEIWAVVRPDLSVQYDNAPFTPTNEIRFRSDDWGLPYCWAWTAQGDVFDSWPGEAMTPEGDWYVIHVPMDTIGIAISGTDEESLIDNVAIEPGWSAWIVVEGDYYQMYYFEPTEEQIAESFS